jgi:hypothetical protein
LAETASRFGRSNGVMKSPAGLFGSPNLLAHGIY